MIDTVTIDLPLSDLLPGITPAEELIFLRGWDTRTRGDFTTWIRNPTPQELVVGYHPTLSAYKHFHHNRRVFVKVQFSAPKLFWGNNLDELENCHAIPVAQKLKVALANMGLTPNRDALLRAQVKNLHYSKNILLGNGYTANEVIQTIGRIQSGGRLQKRESQYNRNGSGVNLFNKSFGFSIYDKIPELGPELIGLLQQNGTAPQVMRLEARLINKYKINHTFEKLDLGQNPTLLEVFDSEKSRQVVTHFWQELVAPQMALVTQTDESPNSIIQTLIRTIPDITIHKAIKVTSLILAGRATGGLSELRTIVLSQKNWRTWARLYKDIKEASQALEAQEDNWWEQIETQLAEYESLSLIEN
jgi:hypothetical protein